MLGYENDCLDSVTGNYKTKQTYSYDNLYQLIKVNGETTYNPYQSAVPEFKSDYSQVFTFDSDGLGNMTSKVSTESVTPHKTIGDNLNYNFNYVYDENFAHRLINAGERYYKYDANGNIICEQDGSFESNSDDTAYHKISREAEGVYSTDYGWGLFSEENGSGGGVKGSIYCRTYKWNERNQLISSVDSNYNTAYVYGQDGQRSNKYTQNSETLYFNKMWTLHTDSGNNVYGGQTAKNIYLGETRIVTKLNSGENPTYQEEYYKQYFYHSDHLGSASLISDYKGDEYQRIEYTPYGETWVEKTQNTGLEFLPYKFTAKELDEETGLYYYGARYLDPKYSMWISTDPALGEYIPMAPTSEEARNYNQNLPGLGGVFNSVNLNLYHYAANNPVKYTDPDGNSVKNNSNEYILIRTEDAGYVILPPNSTYNGKNVENFDYESKSVSIIDMGKVDGAIKSSGDILKVTDTQDYGPLLPDVDIKIDKNGNMEISGTISKCVNNLGDSNKKKKGRTDTSGLYKVGDGSKPGSWIERNPSQEKMKDLAKGKQYFIKKSDVYQILEDSGEGK